MIIYKVTNLVNGKIYIGQTKRKLYKRKDRHHQDAFKGNSDCVFHRALRRYGKENFTWEVIDSAETLEELNEKEMYWISYYNSHINAENSNGYNMTLGGDGAVGYAHSEETKLKLSEAHKGKKLSDETKRKVGIASKGRKCSEYTKQKISEIHRGSKHHNAKLNEEDVLKIKDLIKSGLSQNQISSMFNVTFATINFIKQGKIWTHVGEDVSDIRSDKKICNKLSVENVQLIKKLLMQGLKQKEIAEMFNVSIGTIGAIKSRRTWKHVEVN